MVMEGYEDVIGKKIVFEGHEATIRNIEQNYEGDYIYLDFGIEKPSVAFMMYSEDGRKIRTEIKKLQKEMKK